MQLVSLGDTLVAPIGAGTWAWGNRLLYGYQQADDAALGKAFSTLVSRCVSPRLGTLATLREVAAARGVSMSQVAINWTRARGALPIPGVRTERQAQEVLQCLDWQLSAAEVAELDAASERCPIAATQNPFSVP